MNSGNLVIKDLTFLQNTGEIMVGVILLPFLLTVADSVTTVSLFWVFVSHRSFVQEQPTAEPKPEVVEPKAEVSSHYRHGKP